MTWDEFYRVAETIRKLWSSKSWLEEWNEEQQKVTFRVFQRFTADETIQAFREHKALNLDGRVPKFGEVHKGLKDARGLATATTPGTVFPPWGEIVAWANSKSDGDLTHLWFVVAERYRAAIDNGRKWWDFLESCPLRVPARLGLCWAVERSFDLRFRNGSDEWYLVVEEIDANMRRIEAGKWGGKRQPLKPKPVECATGKPDTPGDLAGEPVAVLDEIPF